MSSSRLVELSARIAANTTKVNDYLITHQLSQPSFDVDGPLESLIPKQEIDIEAARVAVIDDTLELRRLILGPRDYLLSYTHNELLSQQAIVRFRLAHTFPVGSTATFGEIAAVCGLPERRVRQLIRFAVTQRIFCEPSPGVVAHTSVSRLLVEDGVTADRVGAGADEFWQASSQMCNALEKYPNSEELNEAGFNLANQTSKSMYEFLSTVPDRARRFGSAMKAFTKETGFELRHVTDGFPWGDLEPGTVVDVGGSHGHVAFAIARKFPSLSIIVQDLGPVIAAAQDNVPSELSSRVTFMPYNFLTEQQPVKSADVYFFRWVLHNWADGYCTKILRNLIPALKPGAKIVVNDIVLPEAGAIPHWHEARVRAMDLAMASVQNSHERELADWAKVFENADPGFEFQGAEKPVGSDLWILVAEWKGR